MKTLSDLKKTMVLGRRLEMIAYNGTTPPEKVRGVREVVRVQTNGVSLSHNNPAFKGASWFDFPKANELEWHTEKHFTIRDRTKAGEVWCTREYLINN